MEDVNCGKMIDRSVYSVCNYATERPLKTQLYDVMYVPKLAYSSTTHSKVSTFSSPKEFIL